MNPERWVIHVPDLSYLSSIVTNGFDWTSFHGSFRAGFFLRSRGLLVNIRVAVFVIPGEIIWRFGAACVAINALVVDEKLAGDVVSPLLLSICHNGQSYSKACSWRLWGFTLGFRC